MNSSIWIAVGSTITAVGALWQTGAYALAAVSEIDDFLGARNSIRAEQRRAIQARFSRWRYFKRRRELKKVDLELGELLVESERQLEKNYDRAATGWSLVLVGAVIVCAASWTLVTF